MNSKPILTETTDRTVSDVQKTIARGIDALAILDRKGELPEELRPLARYLSPPPGCIVEVVLRSQETNRKVRETAKKETWNLSNNVACIHFTETLGSRPNPSFDTTANRPNRRSPLDLRIVDLVHALDEAEHTQPHFVSLKWFRDTFLPQSGLSWVGEAGAAHHAIVGGLNLGLLRDSKIDNPHNPEFPTTTISLNRGNLDVQRILGKGEHETKPFKPVRLKGDSLSSTVKKDRR